MSATVSQSQAGAQHEAASVAPRYAIYWAPAHGSSWWRWGAHWLGRDETTDTALVQPWVDALDSATQRQITAEPRRYGLHATMKAPFRLAAGVGPDALWQRLEGLVRARRPIELGALHVREIDGFLALTCVQTPAALLELAHACVEQLDDLRAPLSTAEMAHRQRAGLDARGRELVARYGYDRVQERFVWHVTLSARATKVQLQALRNAAQPTLAELQREQPLVVDRLSLFVEPAPGAAFRRLRDACFAP